MSPCQTRIRRAVFLLVLSGFVYLGVRFYQAPLDETDATSNLHRGPVRSSLDRLRTHPAGLDRHEHNHVTHVDDQLQDRDRRRHHDHHGNENDEEMSSTSNELSSSSRRRSDVVDAMASSQQSDSLALHRRTDVSPTDELQPSTTSDDDNVARGKPPRQSVDRTMSTAGMPPMASTADETRALWGQFVDGRGRLTLSADDAARRHGETPDDGSAAVPGTHGDGAPFAGSPSTASLGDGGGDGATRNATTAERRGGGGYIPHRCPPGFDKIADPEYNDWFVTQVVQRSMASTAGRHSSTSFAADEIVILTPISNSAKHLRRYFENVCSLIYPHRLISIVLGEDSSKDGTVEMAREMVEQLAPYFKRVELVRLPAGRSLSLSGVNTRHDPAWQFVRRRHLAKVRNRLLMHGLGLVGPSVRWVLWIDSDLRHVPRDLVRHLLATNQSVVVPNCLWRQDNGQTATYDRNTWQETDLSRAVQRAMAPDELMLEGHAPTRRRFLNDVKTDGDVVPVDGVGGCVLLVDAELHRSGLVFPPYVFDHHIETEGFAKSVARYGTRMYGLPSVNVVHW